MFTLNFSKPPREAFRLGFLKGMAAPALLYHVEPLPVLPEVMTVSAPSYPVSQAMARDWAALGRDLKAVVSRHG